MLQPHFSCETRSGFPSCCLRRRFLVYEPRSAPELQALVSLPGVAEMHTAVPQGQDLVPQKNPPSRDIHCSCWMLSVNQFDFTQVPGWPQPLLFFFLGLHKTALLMASTTSRIFLAPPGRFNAALFLFFCNVELQLGVQHATRGNCPSVNLWDGLSGMYD